MAGKRLPPRRAPDTSSDEVWTLQDAKARLSELVRLARAGGPQHVTVHGKQAVVIVDPARFDVRPKSTQPRTMAGFVEASKKYRGSMAGVSFERPLGMKFRRRRPLDEM